MTNAGPRFEHNLRLEIRSVLTGLPRVQHALENLLGRYEQLRLYDCLRTCLVELVTNALRANLKHAFLTERGITDLANDVEYRAALQEFKVAYRDEVQAGELRRRAQGMGLYVLVRLGCSQEGLCVEVINNLPLRPHEESRIRSRFATAMGYTDLVDYFDDHHDDTEGSGLGFALNLFFLRAENIDPSLFRVGVVDGCTVARIEVPFLESYSSPRQRYAEAV